MSRIVRAREVFCPLCNCKMQLPAWRQWRGIFCEVGHADCARSSGSSRVRRCVSTRRWPRSKRRTDVSHVTSRTRSLSVPRVAPRPSGFRQGSSTHPQKFPPTKTFSAAAAPSRSHGSLPHMLVRHASRSLTPLPGPILCRCHSVCLSHTLSTETVKLLEEKVSIPDPSVARTYAYLRTARGRLYTRSVCT